MMPPASSTPSAIPTTRPVPAAALLAPVVGVAARTDLPTDRLDAALVGAAGAAEAVRGAA